MKWLFQAQKFKVVPYVSRQIVCISTLDEHDFLLYFLEEWVANVFKTCRKVGWKEKEWKRGGGKKQKIKWFLGPRNLEKLERKERKESYLFCIDRKVGWKYKKWKRGGGKKEDKWFLGPTNLEKCKWRKANFLYSWLLRFWRYDILKLCDVALKT